MHTAIHSWDVTPKEAISIQRNLAERLIKRDCFKGIRFIAGADIAFEKESAIGKSTLSDLQEAKKTFLIWHAYHKGNRLQKKEIKKIFTKQTVSKKDLLHIRSILIETGSLIQAKKEILTLKKNAKEIIASSRMKKYYKDLLFRYPDTFLTI